MADNVTKPASTPHSVTVPEGVKTKSRKDVMGAGIIKTAEIETPFFVTSFKLGTIRDRTSDTGTKPIWMLNAISEDGERFSFRLGCNTGRDNQFEEMQRECEQGYAMGPFVLVKKDTGNPLNPMWDLEDVPTVPAP